MWCVLFTSRLEQNFSFALEFTSFHLQIRRLFKNRERDDEDLVLLIRIVQSSRREITNWRDRIKGPTATIAREHAEVAALKSLAHEAQQLVKPLSDLLRLVTCGSGYSPPSLGATPSCASAVAGAAQLGSSEQPTSTARVPLIRGERLIDGEDRTGGPDGRPGAQRSTSASSVTPQMAYPLPPKSAPASSASMTDAAASQTSTSSQTPEVARPGLRAADASPSAPEAEAESDPVKARALARLEEAFAENASDLQELVDDLSASDGYSQEAVETFVDSIHEQLERLKSDLQLLYPHSNFEKEMAQRTHAKRVEKTSASKAPSVQEPTSLEELLYELLCYTCERCDYRLRQVTRRIADEKLIVDLKPLQLLVEHAERVLSGRLTSSSQRLITAQPSKTIKKSAAKSAKHLLNKLRKAITKK